MIKAIKLNSKILILLFCLVYSYQAYCCSMFKISQKGKTIVGNNEDYWNPNTSIWFENGKKAKYSVVYVGFDDLRPQGGINQAGLVFDGFAMPYLAIRDT